MTQQMQQTGGQIGGQTSGATSRQMGAARGTELALSDVETPQQRQAVERISRAIQVCGWCADQCIQSANPMMVECIRLCEDVTELGEVALALVPRQSRFAGSVLQTFAQAAEACARECGQHQDAHCQECARILPQAAQAARQLSGTAGQQQQQQFGQQQQQMQY